MHMINTSPYLPFGDQRTAAWYGKDIISVKQFKREDLEYVFGVAHEMRGMVERVGTFDLVFLDAWKPDYKKFFDMVFPRVAPGGLFLAHNVINKKNDMLDFLAAIEKHPRALTTTVSPGHEGISITYKKR